MLQGAGAPVPAIQVRKVFLGKLNSRQALSFEL